MYKRLILMIVVTYLGFSILGFCQLVQITDGPLNEYHPKWTVDGDTLAYTYNSGSENSLWLVSANGSGARQINTGKNGDLALCWSPGCSEIVFDAYINNEEPPYNLYIYSFETQTTRVLANLSGNELHPAWSPDGVNIAFNWNGFGIYYIPVTGGSVTTVISDGHEYWHPAWSPDGNRIAFTSDRSGNSDVWIKNLSDSSLQQITTYSGDDDRAAWSPDGSKLAFASDRDGNVDVWIYHFNDGSMEQFTENPSYDSHPDWSPEGDKIAFASRRSGNFDVWVKDYDSAEIDPNVSQIPGNFKLKQNFPNPFNPQTTIEYEIKTAGDVELTIYNEFGQKIKSFTENNKAPGTYQLTWDGKNDAGIQQASGIYFYKLVSGDFMQTNKMVLIR